MKNIYQNIPVNIKVIKEFSLLMFLVLSIIIPLFILFKNDWEFKSVIFWFFFSGSIILLCGFFKQSVIDPFYRVWMMVALGLGFIMTRIIIGIVFYSLITPIGIIRRIYGSEVPKNFREFKQRNAVSYWIKKENISDRLNQY